MSEVRMVSIDPATYKTGIALFVNGKLDKYGLIDLSKFKGQTNDRIKEMARVIICDYLNKWKPTMVFIEEPKGRNNIDLVRKLVMVMGSVLGWCVINNAYYEIVMPNVWRKWLGLDQGKKQRDDLKAESIQAVQDMFGINVDDNIADAINIGVAVLNRYSGED